MDTYYIEQAIKTGWGPLNRDLKWEIWGKFLNRQCQQPHNYSELNPWLTLIMRTPPLSLLGFYYSFRLENSVTPPLLYILKIIHLPDHPCNHSTLLKWKSITHALPLRKLSHIRARMNQRLSQDENLDQVPQLSPFPLHSYLLQQHQMCQSFVFTSVFQNVSLGIYMANRVACGFISGCKSLVVFDI